MSGKEMGYAHVEGLLHNYGISTAEVVAII
jgi:hypothetical protein